MRSARPTARLPAAWAVLALLACGPPETSLAIQIVSDMTPGLEVDAIQVHVEDERGVAVMDAERPIETTATLARSLRLAELVRPADGRYHIVLTLLRGDVVIQTRDARARVPRDHVITILVSRDCNGVTCPAATGDPSAAACLGGRCVDPECSEEHPELCGTPECDAAIACDPGPVDCLAPSCTASGACLLLQVDGSCPGGTCDAVVGCLSDSLPAPHVLRPANGDRYPGGEIELVAEPVAGALGYRLDWRSTCPGGFPACEGGEGTMLPLEVAPSGAITRSVRAAPPLAERVYVRIGACDASGCHYSPFRYADVHAPRGDYDGDGDSELAAVIGGREVFVVPGDASLEPAAGVRLVPPTLAFVGPLVLRDLGDADADGFADLAILDIGRGAVDLWRGGAGGLDPTRVTAMATDGLVLRGLARAADVDPDGFADFAALSPDGGALMLYRGGPRFVGSFERVPVPAIGREGSAADLDCDGTSEIVVTSRADVVALHWTDVALEIATLRPGDGAETPAMIAEVGLDLDDDGYPDLAIADEGRVDGARVRIFTGPLLAGAAITAPEALRANVGASFARVITTCGEDALFVGQPEVDDVGSMVTGAGWWACMRDVPEVIEGGRFGEVAGDQLGTDMSCGDFDGDGTRDLVVGAPSPPAGGGSVEIYYGISHCAFTRSRTVPWTGGGLFGSVLAR